MDWMRQIAYIGFISFFIVGNALAVEESAMLKLAKAAQNPLSSMVTIPLQNNFNFGMGDTGNMGYTLNVQPVIPVKLSDSWNLINRIIIPFTYLPKLTAGSKDYFGLGDINPQFYFSTTTNKIVWGIGPQFSFPTASPDKLGSGKYSTGPTAVALISHNHWLCGLLVNNIWSFAGQADRPKVNAMLIQPFINYNLAKGWYITTAPQFNANWAATDDCNIWTVPLGGGVGKILKIGKQPINTQLVAYYNVAKPKGSADWQLRLQVQLLYPK